VIDMRYMNIEKMYNNSYKYNKYMIVNV